MNEKEFHKRLAWILDQISERTGKRFNQADLSKALGMTPGYISRLVRGKSKCPPERSAFWLIWRQRGVDREWLRLGTGEAFIPQETQAISSSNEATFLREEDLSTDDPAVWKRRAKSAEKSLAVLRNGLRFLLAINGKVEPGSHDVNLAVDTELLKSLVDFSLGQTRPSDEDEPPAKKPG